MLAALVAGGYCVFRAVRPIAGLYEQALNDPLGDRDRTSAGPDTAAIRDESMRWAVVGVPLILIAGVISVGLKVAWLRRKLAASADPPVPPPDRRPAERARRGPAGSAGTAESGPPPGYR
jgi:hypothetical protein